MASVIVCYWKFCDSILVGGAVGGTSYLDSKIPDASVSTC